MDDLSITVSIAERPFKVRIRREEEEIFRRAVDDIERKLKKYSQLYAYKDKQDLLSMVLLQYATDLLNSENQQANLEEKLVKTLRKLDQELSEYRKVAP